jgi:hypothetical protein
MIKKLSMLEFTQKFCSLISPRVQRTITITYDCNGDNLYIGCNGQVVTVKNHEITRAPSKNAAISLIESKIKQLMNLCDEAEGLIEEKGRRIILED